MRKIYYIAFAGMLTISTSCSDFMDQESYNSILASEYFNSEKALKTYTNGFINKYLPTPGTLTRGDQYSDICATSVTEAYLRSGYTPLDANNWETSNWSQLHNVNYYLAHMYEAEKSVRNEATMKHYEGVGRFWRAWFYWNKVKTFGDVPWYDKPIDPKDESMLYKKRDSREFVMDKVLEDLNFATTYCSTASSFVNKNVINKYVALALKARICLYEGTYRKYHTELGLQSSSEKWLRECVSACEEMMKNSPYGLVRNVGNEAKDYSSLFKSIAPQYKEVILANEMSVELNRLHDATWVFASASTGNRCSATKSFINMYLNLDGSRFTDQADYNKIPFAEEVKNRDYRLSQTIITPGYAKKVNGVLSSDFAKVFPDLGSQLTYYRIMKWNIDDDSYEHNTISDNSLCVFRYAEILLNYAEAKAELGEMNEAEWNKSIRLLRERSGVNGKAPETACPYMASYYEGVTDKWILEVRRERAVEMYMENVRVDDLMRWKMGEKFAAELNGIYVPSVGTPFDLDGDGKNDLCFYSKTKPRPSTTESGVTYVQITVDPSNDAATTFSLNSDNCLVYLLDREWLDKKYLHPIPQTAYNINPDLGQNPGWDK